jgi:hypothetical protein
MTYTLNFTVHEAVHCNGVYEDFEDAKAKALELVEGEADSSWVMLTGNPELRTRTYRKEVPPPPEDVFRELARLEDDGNLPHRKKKK